MQGLAKQQGVSTILYQMAMGAGCNGILAPLFLCTFCLRRQTHIADAKSDSLCMCTNTGMPRTCRGENLDGRAAAQAAVDEAGQAGGRISAFYCESILSCGGQVVLPAGYLQDVYQVMHAAGALCVADEVNTLILKGLPFAHCRLLCLFIFVLPAKSS